MTVASWVTFFNNTRYIHSMSKFNLPAHARTPYYYYDTQLLRETLRTIKDITAPHVHWHVHYAVKANANPRILQMIAEYGLGADCVSGGEVEAALANGFAADSVVYAGVGKADWEIILGLENGIRCFNVESLEELEVINGLAGRFGKTASVAFRVNPDVDAHTHAKITTGLNENKFGIAMEDLVPAIRCAEGMSHVEYIGLHFHVGSQILRFDVYENLCKRINELQEQLEAEGISTRSINVGGGLGVDYDEPDAHPIPDFRGYFAVFSEYLRLSPGQELHFELGRSVVAQCGTLVAKTHYVKHGQTKRFLILDARFTALIRPAMYDALHAIENVSAAADAPCETYDVVGPICESSDVFAKDYSLPHTERGDIIAIRSAGAYGETMASQYNCRRLPASHFSD